MGGVGKSRLALRAGRQAERVFHDGVWLVELAPLTEPGLVPAAVARGLGLQDEQADDPTHALPGHIGARRLLLVLDNCEHLLAASAMLVARLLRACPHLAVLATSREPLGLEGEVVYLVPPLSLPDLSAAESGAPVVSEAVNLFLERAQASLPGFQLTAANSLAVARLCRRLDGIPLAIEFAAVRLRALSVEQVADRLERQLDLPSTTEPNRPARQQTLRATMDWSYELLTEPERVLWRRLSAFVGGFTLDAAERVCAGGELETQEVLGALVGLVDRSVAMRVESGGQARYRLLETVRQYGRQRLHAAGEEEALAGRHREWCVELAAAAARRWWGPEQRQVLDQLETEHENLRAALGQCVRAPDEAEAGLAICADTWFYWNAQRHLGEGRRWLADLTRLGVRPTPVRCGALVALGTLMVLGNDALAAEPVLEEALALARRLGERGAAVLALGRLGTAAAAGRQLERARELTAEAVRLGREVGDPERLATVLAQAARVALGVGDVDGAIAGYRECLRLCEVVGERWQRQRAALALGVALSDRGEHAGSQRLMRDALVMAADLGDERMTVWMVEGLAWSLSAGGRQEDAARLLGAAATLRGAEPPSAYAGDRARTERCRQAAVAGLGQAQFQRVYDEGARLNRAEALALALERPVSPTRTEPLPQPLPSPLSEREQEIAALIADGLSNKAIAERLSISVRTAENHVSHMLVKLGLRSRTQLASWVIGTRRR